MMLRKVLGTVAAAVTAAAGLTLVTPATASADITTGVECRQFVGGISTPIARAGTITPRSGEGGWGSEAGSLLGGVFSGAQFIKSLIDEANKAAQLRENQAGFIESLEKKLEYLTKGEYNISIVRSGKGFAENVLQKSSCFGTVQYEGSEEKALYDVYVFDADGQVWSNNGNYGYQNWRHYGFTHSTGTAGSTSDKYTYWFPTTLQKSAHDAADARNRGSAGKPAHGKVVSLISDNGLAADLADGKTFAGNKIWAYGPNGSEAQKWVLWDKGNGNWQIETDFRGRMLMDVIPNDWHTHLVQDNGGTNQLWRFEDYGNGWYRVRGVYNMQNGYPNGGCLTADSQGAQLAAWNCDRGMGGGQLWKLA
ncbi:RICIN domain-containing protein [Kitasatospora sp. NPDC056783]|uniref:RICIN domain-containing protein n=1 Tax=Kitasatospora sp. NPDC056783 TaxID=3345943 RepID=UPI0036C12931